MKKKSYDAVDLAKWICAWLVMYIHLAPVFPSIPLLDDMLRSSICRVAVPFFFAVSSFFLFQKMDPSNPTGPANRKLLVQFCGRLFSLYIFWIVVYNLYTLFYRNYNDMPQKTLQETLLGVFFSGDVLPLWYLMASIYAAPAVFLLWSRGRKGLLAGCLIFELLSLLDWPYPLIPIFKNSAMRWCFKEMSLVVNAVLSGIPLMCLGGLCLTDHRKRPSRQWGLATLCLLLLLVVETAGVYAYYGQRFRSALLGMGVTRLPLTYCLVNWLLSADFKLPVKWLGKAFRLSSTWFYCMHWLMWSLYSWVFAYDGTVRYLAVGCLTTISGIPYVAFKLLRHRKTPVTPTVLAEEHT